MARFQIVNLLVVALLLGATVLGSGCVSTRLKLSTNHPGRTDAVAGIGSDSAAVLRADSALHAPVTSAMEHVVTAQEPNGPRLLRLKRQWFRLLHRHGLKATPSST